MTRGLERRSGRAGTGLGRDKLPPCPFWTWSRVLRQRRGRRRPRAPDRPGRLAGCGDPGVAASGLRGRGGAGFPTGEKWRAVRAVGAGPRYAVGNAAEGEPATFKDRLLLRTNPYQVLEGLAIAAYAVGAARAYLGVKESVTTELQALTRALGELRDADALAGVAVELVLGRICICSGRRPGWRR
ncbi:MAG TPA: hypothetical protein VFC13_05080 [Actinomycetes bacterium]|nr:hypothetical protein [Actinomycetes bacterium]